MIINLFRQCLLCLSSLLYAQCSYSTLFTGDPSTIFPGVTNTLHPSPLWLDNKKPYPTNAWFTNFVVNHDLAKPSDPVNMFPYLMRISPAGLSVSYDNPYFYAEPSYPKIISAQYYAFDEQISLGAKEPMDKYGLSSYKGLQVNLQWSNNQQQRFTASIIQGSPYVTAFFTQTSPCISSRYVFSSINQQTKPGAVNVSNRYEIVLKKGNQQTQTWLLYTEKPTTFTWNSSQTGDSLTADAHYNGWVRLVLQNDTTSALVNDAHVLDGFSATIPLAYTQHYYANEQGLFYSFDWQTNNQQSPLILSLPHHRKFATENTLTSATITYSGIKGLMLGETKTRWDMRLPDVAIDFLEPKTVTDLQKKQLQQALSADAYTILHQNFPDDGPYRTGKRLARAARLIVFADFLQEKTIKKQLIHAVENYLSQKMQSKKNWWFEYDTTWGGIIPSDNDYGAKHYNDHHFHYGYWVYSFAVLSQFDSVWVKAKLPNKSFSPKQWIEILIRDYANPSDKDAYFPLQRYQDDYSGHSWASGLSASVDGQNQQSTSEAVNAYYALALYAKVNQDKDLYSWGKFLTAREIVSAQTYWQVRTDSAIYSEKFKKNNWVVANLWGSKVDANAFIGNCSTEYRCGLEYSFGIEMLPLNAISLELLDEQWLKQAYPTIKKIMLDDYGRIENAWRWILVKGVAKVMPAHEKSYFYQKAVNSDPQEYDNGDSKTNTLYFLMSP